MNDKTFISRWSRLKSERAVETHTYEDAPSQQTINVIKTDNIPPLPGVNGDNASNTTAKVLFDEQRSELQQLSNDQQQTDYSQANHQELADITVLTDEDMPPIESLSEKSDFSQFLSSGVSDQLRNLALRKLFNLPQFNVRDGLNDYDEDFSQIPVLAQEVASKMRSWLHEKQDQLTSEINEELNEQINDELNEEKNTQLSGESAENLSLDTAPDAGGPLCIDTHRASLLTENHFEHFIETDDDLGDADLHG